MNLFYAPLVDEQNRIDLNEKESRHLVQVLRSGIGDEIYLTNGRGGMFKGKLVDIQKNTVTVEIIERDMNYQRLPYYLHVAIAPTKQIDRIEWFVEKATEIGITEITPILTKHSERKSIRPDRLEKVAIAAMKQSLKSEKPTINQMIDFREFIRNRKYCHSFIAHCQYSVTDLLYDEFVPKKEGMILIGPEGDFTNEEIKEAVNKGIKEISLGTSRLRTETAGIIACHSVALKNM